MFSVLITMTIRAVLSLAGDVGLAGAPQIIRSMDSPDAVVSLPC